MPVPSPSDLATFKIPTPFASCFVSSFGRAVYLRPTELHALGHGALKPCFDPLADHRPLKLGKRAGLLALNAEAVNVNRSTYSF